MYTIKDNIPLNEDGLPATTEEIAQMNEAKAREEEAMEAQLRGQGEYLAEMSIKSALSVIASAEPQLAEALNNSTLPALRGSTPAIDLLEDVQSLPETQKTVLVEEALHSLERHNAGELAKELRTALYAQYQGVIL
jgi:hypothetical protein